MAAVAASALHSRMLRRDSTDHDVIDVASGVTSNQLLQAAVHIRCTGARNGHVFPRRKRELGKKNQRASKEDRTRFPEHVICLVRLALSDCWMLDRKSTRLNSS